MNRTAISRSLGVAAATGVTSLALCVPASAVEVIPPSGGDGATSATSTAQPVDTSGSGWQQTALGAAGVIAVAGAGVVVFSRRRHHAHAPHPI
jgi:hypothetical protein